MSASVATASSGPAETFREWLQSQGLSDNTIAQRVQFAEGRLRAWGTYDVTSEAVGKWLAGYSGWTRRIYHNHAKSLFQWLVDTGQLEVDPSARVRSTPSPRPRPKPLSAAEASQVLTEASGDLRAWLMLGMLAGLRAHEIAKLAGRDVTSAGIYVLGKGSRAEVVPLHPDLALLAGEYPAVGWWFPSPHRGKDHICPDSVIQRVRWHFRALGIEGSIHRTRATFGTALLRNGENIAVVQELMRHRSLSSTAHYLGVDDIERVTAIGRLAPVAAVQP